jgi:hypothetical protein
MAASSSNSGSLASASDAQIALDGNVDETTEMRLTLKNNHNLSPASVDEALKHDMHSSRGDTGNHVSAGGSPDKAGKTSKTSSCGLAGVADGGSGSGAAGAREETAASSSNSGSLASASDAQQIALGGNVDENNGDETDLKNKQKLPPASVDEALKHGMHLLRGDTGSNHGPAVGSPGKTSETGDKAVARGYLPAGGSPGKASEVGSKTKDNGSGRAFVSPSAVAGEHGVG